MFCVKLRIDRIKIFYPEDRRDRLLRNNKRTGATRRRIRLLRNKEKTDATRLRIPNNTLTCTLTAIRTQISISALEFHAG
jgi:hypothetical protein